MDIDFEWSNFTDFSVDELYAVLRLRQEIFIVEQNCPYLDCDNLDQHAIHLVGWQNRNQNRQPVTYLRIIPPGSQQHAVPHAPLIHSSHPKTNVAIGRVLVHKSVRGRALGRKIIKLALAKCATLFSDIPVRISAQVYLVPLYSEFGFVTASEPYDEDGIEHVEMILT